MKLLKTVRLTGALLAGVLLWAFSANSFATPLTPSGTTISNLATVNYKVGTVTSWWTPSCCSRSPPTMRLT
jgi:hypothetical protein